MIGVALSIQHAFGDAADIERQAFETVICEHAAAAGLSLDGTMAQRLASVDKVTLGSSAGLAEAFSAVLGTTLSRKADVLRFEALFRMAAARVAAMRFVPYDDVPPALSQLRELNIPRAALTAGWPSIEQRKADMSGFDGPIIFAQDFGNGGGPTCSESAFQRLAEVLLLPRELLWFASDRAEAEIVPAAAFGMRTIWVNRAGNDFPSGRPAPDATIASFGELFDVLRAPYTRGLLELRHIMRTALDWRPGHFMKANEFAQDGD
jgi:FMN phosphatase YigB (HAD superfamily)